MGLSHHRALSPLAGERRREGKDGASTEGWRRNLHVSLLPALPFKGGGIAAAFALLCLTTLPAFADEIDDCEKLGAADIARDSGSARPFEIDREALYFDKAETTVGKEFVSSVLHGPAKLGGAGEGETERVRFICLHGGTGKGALFFWLLPD